jgi:serine/threonine-protein phosphatase 6 regulatory subunit 3
MGHLTLISEDVITAMEHSPADLRLIMKQYTPQPEWDEYVTGRYHETKTKDTSLLGGGKPAVSLASRPGNGWKVDEQDMAGTSAIMPAVGKARAIASRVEESRGEFRRSAAARREESADFGSAIPMDEEEDGPLANHGDGANIGEHPQVRRSHFGDSIILL